jgi:hypothetical protein
VSTVPENEAMCSSKEAYRLSGRVEAVQLQPTDGEVAEPGAALRHQGHASLADRSALALDDDVADPGAHHVVEDGQLQAERDAGLDRPRQGGSGQHRVRGRSAPAVQLEARPGGGGDDRGEQSL